MRGRGSAKLTAQNFWVKNHTQVYLVGNPVVWWLSTASILVYVGLRGLAILREKRGYRDLYKREWTTISRSIARECAWFQHERAVHDLRNSNTRWVLTI